LHRVRVAGICLPVMALVGIVAVVAAVALALSSGDEGPEAALKTDAQSARFALESRWRGVSGDWKALGDIQGTLAQVSQGLPDLKYVRFISADKDAEGRRHVFQSSTAASPLAQPLQALSEWSEAHLAQAEKSDAVSSELARSENGACGTAFAPVRGAGGVLLGFVEVRVDLQGSGDLAKGSLLGVLLILSLGGGVWVWSTRAQRKEAQSAGEDQATSDGRAQAVASSPGWALAEVGSGSAGIEHPGLAADAILDRIDAGVVVFDSRGRVKMCNRSACEILSDGLDAHELCGRTASEACRHYPGLTQLIDSPADSPAETTVAGSERSVFATARRVVSAGSLSAVVLTLRDVTAQRAQEEEFEGSAERLLAAEAELEGQSRELAQANARLERLSMTDPVTQLANHRRFMEALSQETERALATGRSLSVAVVDAASFSDYNDRFGYAAGDEVLRTAARVLRRALRKSDVAARLGGGRLAAILPDTELAAALVLGDRLAKHLEVASFAGAQVAFSIGVAEFARHGRTPRELLNSAAAALELTRPGKGNYVAAAPDDGAGGFGLTNAA
jgi:diguanylate cyclase (GGDEF)-like protein/PAS domain S-box-containing protein